MTTRKEENLEYNKLCVLRTMNRVDKTIDAALRSLLGKISTLHTFESVSHSLSKLIKNELDPVFEKWITKHGYKADFALSELIQHDMGSAIANLEDIARLDRHDNDAKSYPADYDTARSREVGKTCDALIEFVFFCSTRKSTYEVGVTFTELRGQDSFDINNERKTISKKDFKKRFLNEFPYGSPQHVFYTHLQDCNVCLACGEPTMEAVARKRLIPSVVDSSNRQRLKTGKKFNDKSRGSTMYCVDHYENKNGSTAGKKARRWRGMFISLLLAMRYKKIRVLMNDLIPPADEFAFAQKAIKNRYCHKHLSPIKKKMLLLTSKKTDASMSLENEIFAHIRSIYVDIFKLTPKPYAISEEDHLVLYENEFGTVLDGGKLGMKPLMVAVSKNAI